MRMAAPCVRAKSDVRAAGDGAANARRAGATVCARAVCISECYSEQRTADARKTTRRGSSFFRGRLSFTLILATMVYKISYEMKRGVRGVTKSLRTLSTIYVFCEDHAVTENPPF